MSNSNNMTVEERLVQHIKSDSIMAAIADEDALTELARTAIEKAFFSPVLVGGTGWDKDKIKHPSKAVEAAETLAAALADRLIDELWDNKDFKKKMLEEAANVLPHILVAALMKKAELGLSTISLDSAEIAIGRLKDAGLINPDQYV